MEHRDKGEAQKEVEKRDEERSGPEAKHTSGHTEPGAEGFPADRDAGSLHHGEMGGNFNEDHKEETTS